MSSERERQQAAFEKRVVEQDAERPGFGDAWREFCDIMLQHGGDLVVPPLAPDALIEFVGQRGTLVPNSTEIVLVPGDPSGCHKNCVALWRAGRATAIGTGYALSDDALWRQHTWAWDHKSHLIETTEVRTRYYGLRLDGDGAQWFADWAAPSEAEAP